MLNYTVYIPVRINFSVQIVEVTKFFCEVPWMNAHIFWVMKIRLQKKSLISKVINRAPLAASEITLFKRSLVSNNDAAGLAVSKVQSSLSPPIVSLTLYFSVLSGWWSQTILAYVIFLCFGIVLFFTKSIVLVPLMLLYPFDNLPNLFDKLFFQTFWSVPLINLSIESVSLNCQKYEVFPSMEWREFNLYGEISV